MGGLAVGICQVDDDLPGREHSHLSAQPGEGGLVADGVEHVDVREGQHVGGLKLTAVGGDHGRCGIGVGHEDRAARVAPLNQTLQQRDRPLRRRTGLLVDDGDVGRLTDRHDRVRGHDRHRGTGNLVKLSRQGVGTDVTAEDHGQQMPEAFRHNHPFLAAGTNSSPDGRAHRHAPFPGLDETSRSEHAPTSDIAQQPGASCRIPGDSHRSRRRGHSLAVTHTTRSTPIALDTPAPQGTRTTARKSPKHHAPDSPALQSWWAILGSNQ